MCLCYELSPFWKIRAVTCFSFLSILYIMLSLYPCNSLHSFPLYSQAIEQQVPGVAVLPRCDFWISLLLACVVSQVKQLLFVFIRSQPPWLLLLLLLLLLFLIHSFHISVFVFTYERSMEKTVSGWCFWIHISLNKLNWIWNAQILGFLITPHWVINVFLEVFYH